MFEFIVIALEPFGSCKRVISCPAACTGTNMPDSAFAAINPSIVRNEYDGNLLYTVKGENICVHQLPLSGYLFEKVERKICFNRMYPKCKEVQR